MFLRTAPKKSGSQLASISALLPLEACPPERELSRLPDAVPVTLTLGRREPLEERRLARACSMLDSAVRRLRFDFNARSSSEVRTGSLKTVHQCANDVSSAGRATSPPAGTVFQFCSAASCD